MQHVGKIKVNKEKKIKVKKEKKLFGYDNIKLNKEVKIFIVYI